MGQLPVQVTHLFVQEEAVLRGTMENSIAGALRVQQGHNLVG
jgi:hypothetical protein